MSAGSSYISLYCTVYGRFKVRRVHLIRAQFVCVNVYVRMSKCSYV